jgi:L,D-peptidoglycan transpeptidase YkuD (ErfK/YbiS/YcfS/YnhG family)
MKYEHVAECVIQENENMIRFQRFIRLRTWSIHIFVLIPVCLIMMMSVRCQKASPVPSLSQQMILVVVPTHQDTKGLLHRYEREDDQSDWSSIGDAIPVVIGRNGLGWGRGLHTIIPTGIPIKREGDGKSPAGVFYLGTVYGFYPAEEMTRLKMPYTQITAPLECVDDANSKHYNRIVERSNMDSVDWNSSEKMIEYPIPYALCVRVEHNADPTENGAGSCIFLHVWSGPDGTTAGCTAMAHSMMEDVTYWMDSSKHPILVQLTKRLYDELKVSWTLPNLPSM